MTWKSQREGKGGELFFYIVFGGWLTILIIGIISSLFLK